MVVVLACILRCTKEDYFLLAHETQEGHPIRWHRRVMTLMNLIRGCSCSRPGALHARADAQIHRPVGSEFTHLLYRWRGSEDWLNVKYIAIVPLRMLPVSDIFRNQSTCLCMSISASFCPAWRTLTYRWCVGRCCESVYSQPDEHKNVSQ